jgi:hypothetical protein
VYVDNVYFYNDVSAPTAPLTAAPDPTRNAAGVISMFSDVYNNVPVDTWRTVWSSAILEDITIQGNPTKKYSALDFVGIETIANQLDITGMTHFSMDVWSADFTFFGVKLVDFGANGAFGGGDDVEHQVNFTMPAQSQWVTLDIPLSAFTGLTTRRNIAQLILVGQPTGANTVYVDNVYFYNALVNTTDIADKQNQFAVYPNPVISGQSVWVKGEVKSIDLHDLSGRKIQTVYGNTIQTNGLDKGLYILKIKGENNKTETGKLIVH